MMAPITTVNELKLHVCQVLLACILNTVYHLHLSYRAHPIYSPVFHSAWITHSSTSFTLLCLILWVSTKRGLLKAFAA